MIALPVTLAPPAPFPLVVAQWSAPEEVAPGIRRADYRLTTNAGPLVIHVVAIDTHDPNACAWGRRVARDHLISSSETVSSMAARTGAVAGINADYFDIGNTNQPLNVVVRDGALLRTPSKRAALDVSSTGEVGIGYVSFAGSVSYGTARVPLTGINEWPPQGGATLLTPAYGALSAAASVVTATLDPIDGVAGSPGTYRVSAAGAPPPGPVSGVLLGFGPAAQAMGPLPNVGDTVTLAFDTTPALASLSAAVGGGPLLLAHGAPVDDPYSPAPQERDVRFPVAGAALEPDGTLLMIVADGRKPAVSIGLTRPEFGALMRGFGATDGLAFDSGGSATLVTRRLGDAGPSVVNDPSDGRERPVADALLAYSDAPDGLHPRLVVRPASFSAYRGAQVALRGAIVDDGDHRMRAADVAPLVTDPAPARTSRRCANVGGTLTATVPYRTVDRVATLTIAPDRPNPVRGVQLPLMVSGADERGAPILLGDAPVRWTLGPQTASGARVLYDTQGGDVTVTASLGAATATTAVRVGNHTVAVPTYAETPLAYDFTGTARAAYANVTIALPGEPVRVSLDVFGDGNGVPLRASFVNRYGEKSLLTLAKAVDWTGWRRVAIALPPDLNPPVRLTSVYVVRSLGGPPVNAAGTLRFRALAVVIPGSS